MASLDRLIASAGMAGRPESAASRLALATFVSACAVLVTAIIACVVSPLMLAAESSCRIQHCSRLGHRRRRHHLANRCRVGRAQVILLDTHAAVWLASDDPALGQRSCSIALAARFENQLAICAISFWEIALLVAKHRLEMHRRPAELRAELLDTGVIELALTGDIALLAVELKNLHGDPADRFIVATAILHNATLVTADARLLRWRGRVKRQNAQT